MAARELRRRLPADHRVVLVDRAADHVYQPSLLWQMVGERRPSQFTRPLDRLQRKGIEFRNTEVQALDLDNRVVVTAPETSTTTLSSSRSEPSSRPRR